MKKQLLITLAIIIGLPLVVSIAWFLFFRPVATPSETVNTTSTSNINGAQSVSVSPTVQEPETNTVNTTTVVQQKVFEVVDGPVAGATVVQMRQPTTTVARYVQQNNGHVFDLVINSSGAVPKAISNTTIPGINRVLWAKQGSAAILQYLDGNVTKTVYLGFPVPNASTTKPVEVKFLPEGIQDIAVSPSGTNIVYLLRSTTGVRGFVAAPDGTGSKELFTLPLSEILITWPSTNTILAYTKSNASVAGIAFSINTSNGAVIPLLHTSGLTITANPSYEYLVYQTNDSVGAATYVRTVKSGQQARLSFNPAPERCIWGQAATSTLYCAGPVTHVTSTYLDFLHTGAVTEAEAVFFVALPSKASSIIALPGGEEGGVPSTIDSMALSPDEKYLLFVRRGDHSLWGVRLP